VTFNNVSMTKKLPAAFVTLTFLVALGIGYMGYKDFKAALVVQTTNKLEVLIQERTNAAEVWFKGLNEQVDLLSSNPNVTKAIQGFSATFGLLMEDPVKDLQAAYIDNNPHPIGSKDLLDRAEDSVPYNYQHENFHPYFRKLNNNLGLYDLFLFDTKGNLIYSVYKELDFATNFETGPYQNSGLGVAFATAKGAQQGVPNFVDFAPYAPSADAPAAFISVKVEDASGQFLGVFAIQVPADAMSNVVASPAGLGDTGELVMIGADGLSRSNSRFDGRHTILKPVPATGQISELLTRGNGTYVDQIGLSGSLAIGVIAPMNILGKKWTILGEFEVSEVYRAAIAQRNKTILFSAISLAVIAAISWFVSLSLTRPLTSVVKSMAMVGDRNYAINLSGSTRGDEIGDLTRALETLSLRSQEFDRKAQEEQEQVEEQQIAVSAIGKSLRQLAKGDLDCSISSPFSHQYEPLREDLNQMIENLSTTISKIVEFSTMIGGQTQLMSRDSEDLSLRTENQAATLEQTAAAVDQITTDVKSDLEELLAAERLMLAANEMAKNGKTVVERTTGAMAEVESSSKEIHDIVGVVADIAFQTKLLALNAGVEAARAGEAGRGFAVVASEVGQLAQKASDAVDQIKTLIERSGQAVQVGVDLVGETEKSLVEIVEKIASISTLVESVTSSSNSQAEGLGEINIGVTQLDQVTQQNASMVEKSNATAQKLDSEANNLTAILNEFNLGAINKVGANFQTDPVRLHSVK
jgi:methyl-accepting chemotaxis protein